MQSNPKDPLARETPRESFCVALFKQPPTPRKRAWAFPCPGGTMAIEVEKQLWCSVIQLAWDDYFAPKPAWKQGISDWEKNRREAKFFLTRSTGDWARSRSDVCSAAGICPDALRDAVLQRDAGR